MKANTSGICFVAVWLLAGLLAGSLPPESKPANSWSPKAAAAYLDQREAWWASWPGAAHGQGTWCVSCHAGVPYSLARPALRAVLTEKAPSVHEDYLIENVKKRVHLWKIVKPFFPKEPRESRGTEAVLNALVLASYDARNGKIGTETRAAIDNMWVLQETSGEAHGAWAWARFGNEPWGANDSQYYGAALAAVSVGIAPEDSRSKPRVQKTLTCYAIIITANW